MWKTGMNCQANRNFFFIFVWDFISINIQLAGSFVVKTFCQNVCCDLCFFMTFFHHLLPHIVDFWTLSNIRKSESPGSSSCEWTRKKKNTSTRIGCEIIEVKASKKSVKNISRKSDTRVRYEVQMNFFPFRKCRMNFVDAFHVKKMIASEKRKKKAVVGHHLRKYHWYVNGNAQSTGVYIRIKWSWSLYWERSSYNRTIVHDISCLRSVQDCWSCCCSSW